MKANLHIHSRYSDGNLWPIKIVKKAKKLGLEQIALTDHDTVAGNKEFIEACRQLEINGIPGVEIDCFSKFPIEGETKTYEVYDSEILGYFPDGNYTHTLELLKQVINIRKKKVKCYLDNAQRIFKNNRINWKDFVNSHLGDSNIDREQEAFTFMKPHLFYYLKKKNILAQEIGFRNFKEIYFAETSNNNLAAGLDDNKKTTIEDAIACIHKDEGYAVIPHLALRFIPREQRGEINNVFTWLGKKKHIYRSFLKYCKELGVWGVEMYYYHDWGGEKDIINKINAYIRTLAEDYKFEFTYGSDFHGRYSASDRLGAFSGEFDGFNIQRE